MELLDWIPASKLSITMLQSNPNAIDYIEKHNISKMFPLLSANPSALRYLYRDPSIIKQGCWFNNPNPAVVPFLENCDYQKSPWAQEALLKNPNTLHLVDFHYMNTNLQRLCRNTSSLAIQLIEDNIDQLSDIAWNTLSSNPSAMPIIEHYLDRISWSYLSSNPSAIHLLLKHPEKISWYHFSKNTHPLAIKHIKQHLNKVNWMNLARNPSAIEILKENQDKIDWYWLSGNPAIFEYDYLKMAKQRNEMILEELISVALHPSRVCTWLSKGYTLSEL
jgi:hypothetical protein